MRPRERRESGEQDLFRSRLDQVINMEHALVKLARTIDWRFLEEKFGAVYADGTGRPPLPTRLMAGLARTLLPDRRQAIVLNRAREKLVKLAKKLGVELRQSYTRVGKFALIQHQRYAHARQFKRANRPLRTLKTYLGRVIRDIARKIDGDPGLETKFAWLLSLARRVRAQERGQRGPKGLPPAQPEVECIGKGTKNPREFF
jgi:hypothetical protein